LPSRRCATEQVAFADIVRINGQILLCLDLRLEVASSTNVLMPFSITRQDIRSSIPQTIWNIEPRQKTRSVYLPAGNQWFDFWTGESFSGGQSVVADAPIEKIPLMVKSGSILPMGPFVQYATEKPADPIELRIYPGADGSFTLYEDENDNYNYEKGVYSTIDFHWDDAKHQLKIDARKGTFPGMLQARTFHIVIVRKGVGAGVEVTDKTDKVISYQGEQQIVPLPQ
jgi:alpha-D-xyloside xylohydrolase